MTPHEVKFQLDATLLALANGGRVPVITDIHSIVCEGNSVSIGFDIVPGDEILFFEFERPREVSRAELGDFGRWLAWSGNGETIH